MSKPYVSPVHHKCNWNICPTTCSYPTEKKSGLSVCPYNTPWFSHHNNPPPQPSYVFLWHTSSVLHRIGNCKVQGVGSDHSSIVYVTTEILLRIFSRCYTCVFARWSCSVVTVICFQLTDIVIILILFAAFISQISALKIAISNFECGEYPRALMYLEMFIKENPQQFQEQLWLFMVCVNGYCMNFKTCLHYLCC